MLSVPASRVSVSPLAKPDVSLRLEWPHHFATKRVLGACQLTGSRVAHAPGTAGVDFLRNPVRERQRRRQSGRLDAV